MLTALLTIAGFYLILLVALYVFQARLVYFPLRQLTATPRDCRMAYEEVDLTAADGTKLSAWFVPAAEPRGVVLVCHGNAGNISHRLDTLDVFHRLRLSVLLFDYRGYGQSEGSPSEEGTYQDAEAAWSYLVKERGIAPGEIVVFGRSLGGAIAARLAAQHPPRALILESTFTSLPDVAAKIYFFLPVRLLARFRYDTAASVREAACPILIVHSPQDELIPYAHGRALFEAAGEPKAFLEITGSHNGGFVQTGQRYVDGLDRFLTAHPKP